MREVTLTYLSALGTLIVHGTNFVFVVDLLGVTIFDETNREELQFMPGDEMLMSLDIEDLGVLGFFYLPMLLPLGFLIKFPFGLLVKLSFEFMVYSCSLYSDLIQLDLNCRFNQGSALALMKLFSLNQIP